MTRYCLQLLLAGSFFWATAAAAQSSPNVALVDALDGDPTRSVAVTNLEQLGLERLFDSIMGRLSAAQASGPSLYVDEKIRSPTTSTEIADFLGGWLRAAGQSAPSHDAAVVRLAQAILSVGTALDRRVGERMRRQMPELAEGRVCPQYVIFRATDGRLDCPATDGHADGALATLAIYPESTLGAQAWANREAFGRYRSSFLPGDKQSWSPRPVDGTVALWWGYLLEKLKVNPAPDPLYHRAPPGGPRAAVLAEYGVVLPSGQWIDHAGTVSLTRRVDTQKEYRLHR